MASEEASFGRLRIELERRTKREGGSEGGRSASREVLDQENPEKRDTDYRLS